jgi:hypothetical protein
LVISGRVALVVEIEGSMESNRVRVCSRIDSERRPIELAKQIRRKGQRN